MKACRLLSMWLCFGATIVINRMHSTWSGFPGKPAVAPKNPHASHPDNYLEVASMRKNMLELCLVHKSVNPVKDEHPSPHTYLQVACRQHHAPAGGSQCPFQAHT